ncbi:hypothetical protein [Streptomyces bauhiniae]
MSASIVRRITDPGRELKGTQYVGTAHAAHLRERLQHTAALAASTAAH